MGLKLCDCGHWVAPSGCSTGYGKDSHGKTFCFACCAKLDKEQMIKTGKIILYLCGDGRITNWPGTLVFKQLGSKRGYHNIAGTRLDTWFYGPDGYLWHGVQYGRNTQLLHCKRTKQRSY